MEKGKLVVFYGINNLGKSTQAKILIERLGQAGTSAEYLKYPVYDLTPTGPELNRILRSGHGQTITEEALQALYAQNRRDFEPQLLAKLNRGIWIIAEDYIGTGLAWGITKGARREILTGQNQGLLKEDLAILFDGERFMSGAEANHLHESDDDLMKRSRQTHLALGEEFGWTKINANQTVEKVSEDIWETIQEFAKS